jgi:hypothetical protein
LKPGQDLQVDKYFLNHCRVFAKSRRPQAILAMILTSPPHSLQVAMSILKTRFNRFAKVIEARFSAALWSASSGEQDFLRLPRLAGVTHARYLLLGANTPLSAKMKIYYNKSTPCPCNVS